MIDFNQWARAYFDRELRSSLKQDTFFLHTNAQARSTKNTCRYRYTKAFILAIMRLAPALSSLLGIIVSEGHGS